MNYFQELAAKYDAWFQTPHGQYVYRYEREMILDLAEVQKNMYVADVGCGTGIYTNEFCAAGARVVGIDISPEMLAIAAEKNKAWGNRVSFVTADAAALPFPDNAFDMVVSITAMEFFEEPRLCLHEMYRILRPGGRMIVATLGNLSLWSIERRIKTWFKRTIFSHTRFYSIRDIARLLDPITISDWRGGIFIPPFAPSTLIRRPDKLERWGQKWIPALGTFLVVRVDKK